MGERTLLVLTGTGFLGMAAGLVGTFAVLRRRALAGDVIAHSALPGICIAWMLVASHSLPALLFGALLSGFAGAMTAAALQRATRLREDAVLGIVLSVFYGGGITLIRLIQKQASGEPTANLGRFLVGNAATMQRSEVIQLIGLTCLSAALIGLLFKEFRLLAFDEQFGAVQGWPMKRLDILLLLLIAMTVIVGLPAVGVLLTAALLIIPAAAARFWTNRLERMILLAAAFGGISGVVGTVLSSRMSDIPTGALIVLVAALIFGVSGVFGVRRGIFQRFLRRNESLLPPDAQTPLRSAR